MLYIEIIGFITLFIFALGISTVLTNWYTKTKEIGNTQILIALCVTAIGLVIGKKVASLKYGDFEVKTAFVEAQNKSIFEDITLIPVEGLVINEKDNYYRLNEEIAYNKPDALSFFLGYKNYGAHEIEKYLETLSKLNLKYIVFDDLESNDFVGIVEFDKLNKQLNGYNPYEEVFDTKDFKSWIQNNDRTTLKRRIKDYVPSEFAVYSSTKKLEALERMDKINLDYLPVIDSLGTFKGEVKRDRLASSLLIEVSKSLKNNPNSQVTQ